MACGSLLARGLRRTKRDSGAAQRSVPAGRLPVISADHASFICCAGNLSAPADVDKTAAEPDETDNSAQKQTSLCMS